MSSPTEPPREKPSTYMVQNRDNIEEMDRLEIQDKMLTTGMGGVLPELEDPMVLRSVLDVGCGTGDWLIETAKTYPTIEKLVGGDISDKMLGYAHARAEAQQVSERVQFQAMDALRVLAFPTSSFDLVNQRLGLSWLRTWEWKKLLLEYQRVCRPGGIIRITEGNAIAESNSAALTKLWELSLETFYRSGRLFTPTTDGITGELVRVMTQYGIENVNYRVHNLVHRAGELSGQYYYEDTRRFFRVLFPFFQRWTRIPADYEAVYQQALLDMQQPGFVVIWPLLTAWGTRSTDVRSLHVRGLT